MVAIVLALYLPRRLSKSRPLTVSMYRFRLHTKTRRAVQMQVPIQSTICGSTMGSKHWLVDLRCYCASRSSTYKVHDDEALFLLDWIVHECVLGDLSQEAGTATNGSALPITRCGKPQPSLRQRAHPRAIPTVPAATANTPIILKVYEPGQRTWHQTVGQIVLAVTTSVDYGLRQGQTVD